MWQILAKTKHSISLDVLYNIELKGISVSYINTHHKISLWFVQLTLLQFHLSYFLCFIFGFLHETLGLD